jgi:hypothetical protein
LVPLVVHHCSLLPLVFIPPQFCPTLVPFAQQSAWSPSPSILTCLTGRAHCKIPLLPAQPPLLFLPTPTLPLSPSPGSLLLASMDAAWRLANGSATRQEASSPARRPTSSTAWQQPRREELQAESLQSRAPIPPQAQARRSSNSTNPPRRE